MLACAVMMGCSGGADPEPEDPSPSEAASSPAPSASEQASPSAGDSESERESQPEEPESEASEPAAAAPAATSRTLAIEQRHPNGSVLRLTSLEVEASAITVGIEVVNGSGDAFGLSPGGAEVTLTDDLGGVYEYLRPEDNPDLEIEARGTLTGELVYFGVVDPEAATLLLQTSVNPGTEVGTVFDPSTESPNEPFPHFSVEIPLAP